jgi:hypothetical protein
MRTHLAAAALAACFVPTAFAQLSSSAQLAPQFKPGFNKPLLVPSGGSGTTSLVVGGSDDCSTPDAIAGVGPHAFNTTAATTGAQGQANASCLFFGTTGIANDVWFNWTAGATGAATLSVCGGAAFDTKVAVYGAGGCPGGAPLACNDDSCGLQSQLGFAAVNGTTYAIQVGLFPGAAGGSGSFTINVSGGGGANDACSSPAAIAGSGPHNFDTSTATTGAEGQANANCNFFGTTGIANDVWYTWTAGGTGTATVSFCGGSGIDTKVAVYNGTGCPAGAAIACNDDACGLQSTTSFPATNGTQYTIQVGVFPGAAGGAGSFTINISGPLGPCSAIDDGSSTTSVGLTAGGGLLWMQRFGSASGPTTVQQIQGAFGSPTGGAGQNPPNGTPIQVAIWDDPNDDGNPSDGVLLQTLNGSVTNTGTDIFANFNLAPAQVVNGYLFVGISIVHPAGQFPAPLDQPVNPASNNAAWVAGNSVAVNLANLGANSLPPTALSSIAGLDGQWLLRVTCGSGGPPFTAVCAPGVSGVTACPCGNPGVAGRGCNNSAGTGGAGLTGTGNPSVSADTAVLTMTTAMPSVLAIIVQGNSINNGVQFGQGILCASGTLLRMETGTTSASGTLATTSSLAARSAFLGDVLSAGSVRVYQGYYRDPTVLGGCNPTFTFNASSGQSVNWQP